MRARIFSDARGLFLLSLVCGMWDVAAFYRSLVFVTGMSGNIMILALNLAGGDAGVSIFYICIYLAFVAGSATSYVVFHLVEHRARQILTATSVGCVVVSEVINNLARVEMGTTGVSQLGYPLSSNHWSLLFLAFASATLNLYASREYGYGTVTFITVTSQNVVYSVAGALLLSRVDPLQLSRQLSVVVGYTVGCVWIAVFNAHSTLEGRYWITISTAGILLLNNLLDCSAARGKRTPRHLEQPVVS